MSKICEGDEEEESDNPDNVDYSDYDCHASTGLFAWAIRSQVEYLLSKKNSNQVSPGVFKSPISALRVSGPRVFEQSYNSDINNNNKNNNNNNNNKNNSNNNSSLKKCQLNFYWP